MFTHGIVEDHHDDRRREDHRHDDRRRDDRRHDVRHDDRRRDDHHDVRRRDDARADRQRDDHHDHLIDTRTGEVIEFFDAEIERLKSEIAERLGFELVGHKLELYGKAIAGAEPSKREGLIFSRTARRVDPDKLDV